MYNNNNYRNRRLGGEEVWFPAAEDGETPAAINVERRRIIGYDVDVYRADTSYSVWWLLLLIIIVIVTVVVVVVVVVRCR